MKRWIILLLAMLLTLSLTACSSSEGEKPSGNIADIGSGEAGQSAEQTDPGDAVVPDNTGADAALSEVKIKGDTVIQTSNDGMGTKTVTEYRYQDGVLGEMVLTYEYTDMATAETIFKEMENGSLKQTADASYSEFRQNGSKIICTMNESMIAVFSGMSKEELAAFLSGEQTSANPFGGENGGGADSGETTIKTNWDALDLPEDFPKLTDGVTNYAKIDDSSFSMDWDYLPEEQANDMAAKLEEWSGAKAEVYADENGANWNISSDTCSITLTYYADTFDGSMPQVTLGVMIFE